MTQTMYAHMNKIFFLNTWKCHNETPCIPILNIQKCLPTPPPTQNGELEGKTDPVWGLVPVGWREDIRKVCWRLNVVDILCTHV
jgi:hypothetical protein